MYPTMGPALTGRDDNDPYVSILNVYSLLLGYRRIDVNARVPIGLVQTLYPTPLTRTNCISSVLWLMQSEPASCRCGIVITQEVRT